MNAKPNETGLDGEKIWPHWECPNCDAPNAGVEQCDPRYGAVLCDECHSEMSYMVPIDDDE